MKTTATDLVTETDRAVEKLIVNGLKSNFPTHKFIGEEGTAELGGDTVNEFTDDPTWIIDPIDGTMNFVHRYYLHWLLTALSGNLWWPSQISLAIESWLPLYQ